jgi:hypothetical protein
MGFLGRISGVYTFNMAAFENIAAKQPWLEIFGFIILYQLMAMVFGLIRIFLKPLPAAVADSPAAYLGGAVIGILFASFVSVVIIGVLYLVAGSAQHLLFRLFGGRGAWSQTVSVYGYLFLWALISSFIGGIILMPDIPLLGLLVYVVDFVLLLVMMAELTLAAERIHGLGRVQAAVAVLIMAALIVLAYIVFVMFIAALLVATGLYGAQSAAAGGY